MFRKINQKDNFYIEIQIVNVVCISSVEKMFIIRDKRRPTWLREVMKVDDGLRTVKKKKYTCRGHIMLRTDN